MKNTSVNTAEKHVLTGTEASGAFIILEGSPEILQNANLQSAGLPCYYLNREKKTGKLPGWITAVSCPDRKDISLTRTAADISGLFDTPGEIFCLDWLDPDFQLPAFGKKKKIILFDNENRLLCFEDGSFTAKAEVCPAASVKEIKQCRRKIRQENLPVCILINTGSPAFEQIIREIADFVSSGQIDSYSLFAENKSGKKGNYEIFNLPVPDSPLKRSRRSGESGQEYISRRDLIADMTGIVELDEADVQYVFKTGFLTSVTYQNRKVLENPLRGAYLKNGKKKAYFQRESSFSFDGDDVRGLRECLVYDGQNKAGKGRIITDYFLCGDYKGLFVSMFIQYPKSDYEFYDSYNVWETELGTVPQDTVIKVQRSIAGKSAPEKQINAQGVYHFPADCIYIEAGEFRTGIRIMKKRGSESEIFSVAVQPYRKNRFKISISMLGSYTPVHHSEYHRFSESLSFCLYPGNPSDFPKIPEDAKKEAYAAKSWKKL